MTKTKTEEQFHVKAELIWRDYENDYEHKSIERIFKGKSKADVYGYIRYYNLMWGMVDCIHLGEGWGNTDSEPDMDSPEVKNLLVEQTVETKEPGLLL
tara:strand:- start:444 stop:737 length:294 start_codon:yes stop_codon:yes gene_type:complete